MQDRDKTKAQLLSEAEELRRRVALLEAAGQNDGPSGQRPVSCASELAIFQSFAEACGQGFGMAHLDGRITYVNPRLCRLIGEASPEDVIGKHFSAYYPEECVQRTEKEILPVSPRKH